jgi:hypothetical protein
MSYDGIFAFLLCCAEGIACAECCTKNYREVKTDNYRIIYDHDLYENSYNSYNRYVRNRDGNAICGWCNEIITNNKMPLVQCVSCSKILGHLFCFTHIICPYCT